MLPPLPLVSAAITALFATRTPAQPIAAPPPSAEISFSIVAPDATGPWKLVAENRSPETLRFAADGRLLMLEIEPLAPADVPDAAGTSAAKAVQHKRVTKPPKPVQCKLPADMRPSGVVDERALLLRPGERYEEVFSPALFCFDAAQAKALIPGARVTAHLGFAVPVQKGAKPVLLRAPFVAEPVDSKTSYGPVKELVSNTFTVPPMPASDDAGATRDQAAPSDAGAPQLDLLVPARVDAESERTVGMTARVKNIGGRPALLHLRRDNFMFRVDGPSESADCGTPSENRTVARDQFSELKPQGSIAADIWVGEMCSDVVFDRPGLYRVGVALAFPNTTSPGPLSAWQAPLSAKQPVLVRVREGRLPFYSSPPEALGR